MAAAQSWTAWILDAYASAVSSGSAEQQEQCDSSDETSSTSSPYGPYVRAGRGGAGNFTWQTPQSSPQITQDELEAQKPSTLSERRRAAAQIEHLDTGAAVKAKASQRPTAQYVRVGRGFVPSNEIQQSPLSPTSSTRSPILSKISSPAVAHPGRGGAGNHAAAAAMNETVKLEEEERDRFEAEQRREKIEEQVESVLPTPPDAWLGGRRRSMNLPERHI